MLWITQFDIEWLTIFFPKCFIILSNITREVNAFCFKDILIFILENKAKIIKKMIAGRYW